MYGGLYYKALCTDLRGDLRSNSDKLACLPTNIKTILMLEQANFLRKSRNSDPLSYIVQAPERLG